MNQDQLLLVIAGPTAVGKTHLCVRLAQAYNTEIISADSRQFYREMYIGTAKPTPEEQGGVPHHFVDFLSVHDHLNAGQFEKQALEKIDHLLSRHGMCILTGGSGLYLRAITEGMDDMPEVPDAVREKYNALWREEGLEALWKKVKEADPAYFAIVDQKNPVRLIRALEVMEVSGRPYSSFRQKKKVERPFRQLKIVLDRPREELYERIDQRMDMMIEQGLFEEAEKLYPIRHLTALQTVGYQEIFGYMDGAYDRKEAIRLLKRNTRRYAKRQLTWFRKEADWHWFHPDQFDDIKALIGRAMGDSQMG